MLFGHQTNDIAPQTAAAPIASAPVSAPSDQAMPGAPVVASTAQPGVNPLALDAETGVSLPVAPPEPLTEEDLAEPSVLNQPMLEPAAPPLPPPSGLAQDSPAEDPFAPDPSYLDALQADSSSEVSEQLEQPGTMGTPPSETPGSDPTSASYNTPVTTPDNLLGLKQQAMGELSPLLSQLDQSPEERFRTTMMMIQSTDNPDLIGQAYDAAKQISDDKVRAQALLDVINEINYFTQHKSVN